MAPSISELEYVRIESFAGEVGWRFDDLISSELLEYRDVFMSPRRYVCVPSFEIARRAIHWEGFCSWDEDDVLSIESLPEFCARLEVELSNYGLRLPTEDEFEVACGRNLFPWGNEIPAGLPIDSEIAFTRHREPNEYGLLLNSNPYHVEVVRNFLKLGDGGLSICGGEDTRLAWLALSPAHRCIDELIEDCLPEMFEDTYVRPVRLG